MINEKTLLILGAGASMDYGFPSGQELIEDITNILHGNILFHNGLINIHNNSTQVNYNKIFLANILKYYFSKINASTKQASDYLTDVEKFENNLTRSNTASIDDFISKNAKNSPEYSIIGKVLIVLAISEYEQEDRLMFNKKIANREHRLYSRLSGSNERSYLALTNGWYNILWEKIYREGDVQLNMSRLAVINFNYDRSLAQYLYGSVKGMLKYDEEQTIKCMSDLYMFPMYGRMGALPWEDKPKVKPNPYKPIDNIPFKSFIAEWNDGYSHYRGIDSVGDLANHMLERFDRSKKTHLFFF